MRSIPECLVGLMFDLEFPNLTDTSNAHTDHSVVMRILSGPIPGVLSLRILTGIDSIGQITSSTMQ